MDHFDQMASYLDHEVLSPSSSAGNMVQLKLREAGRVAFADLLALHLSQFARNRIATGVIPTDELFQQEARRFVFGDEDGWNQTLADNQQWLKAFKEQESWLDRIDYTGFG